MNSQENYLSEEWSEHPTIEGVFIRKLCKFEDKRGSLMELERSDQHDQIANHMPMMSYYSETDPGEIRGPHEHERQTDLFFFIGGIGSIHLWDNRVPLPDGAVHRRVVIQKYADTQIGLLVPPGVVHGYRCQPGSLHKLTCVNMPNALYKGHGRKEEVDEIRHEDDPNSPFKI